MDSDLNLEKIVSEGDTFVLHLRYKCGVEELCHVTKEAMFALLCVAEGKAELEQLGVN